MSRPPCVTPKATLNAAVLAILAMAGSGAIAAAPSDGAFDLAAARGTAFTDALVPASGEPLLAQAGDAPGACLDGSCAAQDPAATPDTVAPADTRSAATASPAAAPVRAGVDGKPAGIGSVPEPQTYALLCGGLGLIGIGARTSRRRRQSK